MHFPLDSSASDVDLCIEREINSSSDPKEPTPIPVELLSSDDRNRIDQLVRDRSEARWSGDYAKADEIRETVDNTRVVIPWDCIVEYVKDREQTSRRSTE